MQLIYFSAQNRPFKIDFKPFLFVRYINYCWKCGYPINEDKYNSRRKCSICGGYHCPHCGECLCGFNNKN